MGFRRLSATLAIFLSCIVFGSSAQFAFAVSAQPAAAAGWHTVSYGRVSISVPVGWPVTDLGQHPKVCPRLDRHAVYLGTPGPDPVCPAVASGKAGSVQILPVSATSPDDHNASTPGSADAISVRTNSDQSVSHTIIEIIPSAGMEVSLSYGRDLATIKKIQASIKVKRTTSAAAATMAADARPAAVKPAATATQGVYSGPGFDTCGAPSLSTMSHWLKSPYRAVGIYIGGVNRGCAQANLTSAWISSVRAAGWHYFPFYVGPQASCVDGFGDTTIVAAKAAAEGKAAAQDAVQQARDLGIPAGTPLIYDMEAYGNCGQPVITFLSAWDSQLHAERYKAGVYESFSNIANLISAAGKMTEPDVIHYADWDGKATTTSSYMPKSMWTGHARLHQYRGGHNETWGGATLNIDTDQLNVRLGGSGSSTPTPPAPPPLPFPFRIALGMNSNTTAEWFATAANGTVVHSFQHPIGATSWARSRTVGDSPDDLVSSPAVSSDQDGKLTLFAVTKGGAVVHAWQQAGAPDDWQWSGATGSGSAGTVTSDPAAVREPGGEVAVFVTDTDGTVMSTRETSDNADPSYLAWTAIGGDCRSSPVPFSPASGGLAIGCVTKGGRLADAVLTGNGWSAWQTAAGLSGLTGVPAMVTGASGQTYAFADASTGGIAAAYQRPGSSAWIKDSRLPAGARPGTSPAAIRWPGGTVAVFSRLANGHVGYAVAAIGGRWSGWTDLRRGMQGSPTAWLDASGEPEAAIVTAAGKVAVAGYARSAWTSWTPGVGGF
jgi:hypothetical protein